ncbi:hypothetical protein TcCL_Unassigned01060 [Trypanosoma cruzi]|nr:hypothetical protein TcCL_Unassigned01060 [Trypanosoma cruzi]
MAYRVRFTPTPGPGPPFTFPLGRADVLEDGGRLVGYRIYLEKKHDEQAMDPYLALDSGNLHCVRLIWAVVLWNFSWRYELGILALAACLRKGRVENNSFPIL